MKRLLIALCVVWLWAGVASAQTVQNFLPSAISPGSAESELTDLRATLTVTDETATYYALYTVVVNVTRAMQVTMRIALDDVTIVTQTVDLAPGLRTIILPKAETSLALGGQTWKAFWSQSRSSGTFLSPSTNLYVSNTAVVSTTPVIPNSTLANLPAAGTAGRTYRLTDGGATGALVVDDGAAFRCFGEKDLKANIVTCPPYNAVGDNVASDTAAIQAAINAVPITGGDVVLPPGNFRLTADLIWPLDRHVRLIGAGRRTSSLRVAVADAGGFTSGILHLRGNTYHQTVENLDIRCAQPDTATRASLTQYKPAIFIAGGTHFTVLRRLGIATCWDGVVIGATGNPASNHIIEDMLNSSFNVGIDIINSQDSVKISRLHSWYYFTTIPNHNTILNEEATMGVRSARMDDLKISDSLFIFGTALHLRSTADGTTFGTVSNSDFDTQARVKMDAGSLQIGTSLFTCSAATGCDSSVIHTNGFLNISGSYFLAVGAATGPQVKVEAASGVTPVLNLTGNTFNTASDVGQVSTTGAAGGQHVTINDNTIWRAASSDQTKPVFHVIGGPGPINIIGNTIRAKGTGTGDFIKADSGAVSLTVTANHMSGWGFNYPSASTTIASYGNRASVQTGADPEKYRGGIGLHIPDGLWPQFENWNAGPPDAGDCAGSGHRGRQIIDTTNNRLYICNGTGARAWDFIPLTD